MRRLFTMFAVTLLLLSNLSLASDPPVATAPKPPKADESQVRAMAALPIPQNIYNDPFTWPFTDVPMCWLTWFRYDPPNDDSITDINVYRDGHFLNSCPVHLGWCSDSQFMVPGVTYNYEFTFVDGAGNESARSEVLQHTTFPCDRSHETTMNVVVFPARLEGFTDYPFSREHIEETFFTGEGSLRNFILENSYGRQDFVGEVKDWVDIPFNIDDHCGSQIVNHGRRLGYVCNWEAFRAYLFDHHGMTWNDVDRMVMVLHGVGTAGQANGSTYFFFSSITAWGRVGVLAHELGHTMGAKHAGTWECPSGGVGPHLTNLNQGGCSAFTYTDKYDCMGVANRHYNVWHKEVMGWLNNDEIQVAHASGTYTIVASDVVNAEGIKMLRLPVEGVGHPFYFPEYRKKVGFDAIQLDGIPGGPPIDGVIVRLHRDRIVGTGVQEGLKYTSADTLFVGPILYSPGQEWKDIYRGLTVKLVSKSGNNATLEITYVNPPPDFPDPPPAIPDEDRDGIADAIDNCISVPNVEQEDFDSDGQGDACDVDDDNDGVHDTSDNCPFVMNPTQEDADNDGFGNICDSDDDNDGIPDFLDNCSLVMNSTQADLDGDGQGDACDPDDDNDGLPDEVDQCPIKTCADTNNDGVRDDVCKWWDCEDGECISKDIAYGDMGGAFGSCEADGVADSNDFYHALNCFSNSSPTGVNGEKYPCEANPPVAYNVDVVGFASCEPDGFCDANDAFAALNAFSGNTQCGCEPGVQAFSFEASATSEVALKLVPNRTWIPRGGSVEIDVFLAGTVDDLRGYQLHMGSSVNRAGTLVVENIYIKDRKDWVFHNMYAWSRFNVGASQMFAGLSLPGIKAPARGYLGTFVFTTERQSFGAYTLSLLFNSANNKHRSFLFATKPGSTVAISDANAVSITVGNKRQRTRKSAGQ